MGETIGFGIVDSGCVDTLAGQNWFNIYVESLSVKDRKRIYSEPANSSFRFDPVQAIVTSGLMAILHHF